MHNITKTALNILQICLHKWATKPKIAPSPFYIPYKPTDDTNTIDFIHSKTKLEVGLDRLTKFSNLVGVNEDNELFYLPLKDNNDLLPFSVAKDITNKELFYMFLKERNELLPLSVDELTIEMQIEQIAASIINKGKFETHRKEELTETLTQFLKDNSNDWDEPAVNHTKMQIAKCKWDNWRPLKLFKSAFSIYLSNKAVKFAEIYSNSKDINEAAEKFAESLGAIDKNGIVIPFIQSKILDVTKKYVYDNQLLDKALVQATELLFSSIKPVDSLAHTTVTMAAPVFTTGIKGAESLIEMLGHTVVQAIGEASTSYTDNFVDFHSVWNA